MSAERLFRYYVRRAEYDKHNNNSMGLLDAIMRVAKGESTVYDARLLAAAVGVDYCLVRELYRDSDGYLTKELNSGIEICVK